MMSSTAPEGTSVNDSPAISTNIFISIEILRTGIHYGFLTLQDLQTKASYALRNRSLTAINFTTYSGPRHRDYSFGLSLKVDGWLMGNQFGGAEFSEALWEERTEKTHTVKSDLEKNNCHCWKEDVIRVTEWEMSAEHQFTQRHRNECMKKKNDEIYYLLFAADSSKIKCALNDFCPYRESFRHRKNKSTFLI